MTSGIAGSGTLMWHSLGRWSGVLHPQQQDPLQARENPVLKKCPSCDRWWIADKETGRYCSRACIAKARRGPGWGMRQCLTDGCREGAVAGRSRCGRHGPKNRGRTGPNPYGYAHQLDAKQVLAGASRCAICGLPPTLDNPLEADHIVPLSLGGQPVLSNLQPAHKKCNIAKGGSNRLRQR